MKTTQDHVIELAQKCLSEVPLVVLGSGASRQYGVGGMDELGACLRKNVVPEDKNGERAICDKFVADVEANGDLENALHRVTLPSALESRVVEETRKLLLADDQAVFGKIADGSLKLTLAQLLRHLLRTTNPNIVVVTTNYDRLAEYAADQANVPHHTGFSHGYALSRTASPALIAEYQTQLPDRALLLRKLHEFYELAQSPTETEIPQRKPRKSAK